MKKFLIPLFLFSVVILLSAAPPILRQFGTTNTPTVLTNIIQSLAGVNSQAWTNNGSRIYPTDLTLPVSIGTNNIGDNPGLSLIWDILDETSYGSYFGITAHGGTNAEDKVGFGFYLSAADDWSSDANSSVAGLFVNSTPAVNPYGYFLSSTVPGNTGLLGRSAPSILETNIVGCGVLGIAEVNDGYKIGTAGIALAGGGTNFGVYGEVRVLRQSGVTRSAGAFFFPDFYSKHSWLLGQDAVVLADSGTNSVPIFVGRTNNGTTVAALDVSGIWTARRYVVSGTTNQIIFAATNTSPVSAATPTKWISVQVQGESTVYRVPLYE